MNNNMYTQGHKRVNKMIVGSIPTPNSTLRF